MTKAEYRSADGISASDIKEILANAYLFKIGYKPERTAQAQARLDLGSAIHSLILEPNNFNKDFAIMPTLNLRTNDGKAKYAELVANEKRILISEADFATAKEVAQVVADSKLYDFTQGECETAHFGEIDGAKVKCMPDCFFKDKGLIIDIKTTRNGGNTPDEFQKACANFGYYIQASLYLTITGAKEFVFLAVDIDTKTIGLYELDFIALDFGLSEVKRAIEIYKNLDKVNNLVSADFAKNITCQTLSLPNYVFYKNGAKI